MSFIDDIRKEYNTVGMIHTGEEIMNEHILPFPTGVITLDGDLGIGGLPSGRITEISGPPSAGKTSVCLSTIAQCHKSNPDNKVLYVDAENALDVPYALKSGVDMERFIIVRPEWGEQAFAIAEKAIRSGDFQIVVLDSVPAISPRAEMEGEIGDAHVGLVPRLISQFLRRTAFAIRASQVCVIFTNQVRDKISRIPFPQLETPGGYALKHYSSVRIFLRNAGEIKSPEGPLGSKVSYIIKKNKIGPSFAAGNFEIWNDRGVCGEAGLLDLLLDEHIIEQRGSWFRFGDTNIAQGRNSVIAELTDNADLVHLLMESLIERGELA